MKMGKKSFQVADSTSRWTKFRETLRREDQLDWDEMWKATEVHKDAIAAGEGNEFEKQFMAMMIEKKKIDSEFELKVDDLKKRITAFATKNQPDL